MTKLKNKQWIYTTRPTNEVSVDNYTLTESDIGTDNLHKGEVIIKSLFISVDPYMRIQQSAKNSWEKPHPLNTVQSAAVVGEIIAANATNYKIGDKVLSHTGWQQYAKCHVSEIQKIPDNFPCLSYALGVLGMPGRTAYFGLLDAGKPRPGETLIISGAAGAVGSMVAQIGKLAGCKVIGIAGGQEKKDYLIKELGLDDVIDYKIYNTSKLMTQAIEDACPEGVDIYFDNVGGYITDSVIKNINKNARIVICGQISQYSGNLDNPTMGPRFLHRILYTRSTIQGILARDFTHKESDMYKTMIPWLKNNQIKYQQTIVDGFGQLPNSLNMLFHGKNTGKLIVKI